MSSGYWIWTPRLAKERWDRAMSQRISIENIEEGGPRSIPGHDPPASVDATNDYETSDDSGVPSKPHVRFGILNAESKNSYSVYVDSTGCWTCTCPDFARPQVRTCKHVRG
eukprot:TRINITY_DN556_c0_g2_i1.p3 TRINITY_DN556_c0_g2~~TRINITY_DN556_c0_g2_i1.p3  ORF type:complete len:111 (-),score=7.80 TRINITY_DN556_c0_g2_i1:418-750(-)